jgi:hypothetical protein
VRIGLVGQRTQGLRRRPEFQRGGFAQYTFGKATAGVYWFNPGTSDQVVVGSIGVAF